MWYKDINHFKSVNGYEMKNGQWYPRVTRIVAIKAKPALEKFYQEVESYSSAQNIKRQSASEGSLVHDTVEKLLLGEQVAISPNIRPAVESFLDFVRRRGIMIHPDFVECRIWSQKHRYAGTVDALAMIDNKFGVLDIKTSSAIFRDYNLQTAAYLSALNESEVNQTLKLPRPIETRWILRIDQVKVCRRCGATLRSKGGRTKIRNNYQSNVVPCPESEHQWGDLQGEIELQESPYWQRDWEAFLAAKKLWEWENYFWLKEVGYFE